MCSWENRKGLELAGSNGVGGEGPLGWVSSRGDQEPPKGTQRLDSSDAFDGNKDVRRVGDGGSRRTGM